MPDPRTPSDYESVSTPVEATSTDDGFNRRLGLGLVISIGANVLLLQGAGLLAKNMSLNAPAKEQALVFRTVKKSDVLPSPTPTPEASPTPKVTEKVAVKPTPQPRTPPTPKPERVKPTPRPLHERNRPTPVPTPEPVPTPQTAVATPKPTENAATTTAAVTPARSAETPRQSSASANNLAAKGTSHPSPAIANRTSSTATPEFKPTFDVAPTREIKNLPEKTLAGEFKAIFNPSAGARSAASSTNSASPEVITANTAITTTQAVTHNGHVAPGTQRVAVMVNTRPSSSAADTFVLPTTGGTAKPGQAMKAQGNSASSTVAAMSASSRTTLATGGNGSEPEAIVNAGSSSVAVGTVGVSRPGHPFSKAIGATLADIGHKGGNGAGTGISLSSTAIGGTNNGGGTLRSASAGTSNASYGGGAGRGSGAGLAGNGTSLTADASGGGGGGFGGTGISAKGGNGRGGKGVGPHAVSIGGGGVKGGDGSGDPGLSNGAVGGGGNGKALVAGAMTGGTAEGIGTTNHSGPVSNGTSIKAVTGGGGTRASAGGVKQITTDAQVGDKEAGRTYSATYRSPSTPAIPESLKTQTFDVTATVRAVISATGQVRASIIKSSGYPALDDLAVSAVSNLHVTKVAYENGSPASDTHEFNFTFHNKG